MQGMLSIRRIASLLVVMASLSCIDIYAKNTVSLGHDHQGINKVLVGPANQTYWRNSEGSLYVNPLNDNIILTWTGYYKHIVDNSVSDILQAVSSDGGVTWTAPQVVLLHDATHSYMEPSILYDKSSQKDYLIYTLLNPKKPNYLQVMLRTKPVSSNTWSTPSVISNPNYYSDSLSPTINSGRLLIPVEQTLAPYSSSSKFSVVVYYSDDQGKTWKTSHVIQLTTDKGAMEPNIIIHDSKNLTILLRNTSGYVYAAKSVDNGATWGAPYQLTLQTGEEPTANCVDKNGVEYVIYNDHPQNPASPQINRCPLGVAESDDKGKSWFFNGYDLENNCEGDNLYAYPKCLIFNNKMMVAYFHETNATFSEEFMSYDLPNHKK